MSTWKENKFFGLKIKIEIEKVLERLGSSGSDDEGVDGYLHHRHSLKVYWLPINSASFFLVQDQKPASKFHKIHFQRSQENRFQGFKVQRQHLIVASM
jgi:hypothetical protein